MVGIGLFATERGGPFTPDAVKRIGKRAGLPFQTHAHMPRDACAYALANAGHGNRRISGLARPSIDPAHHALHAIERGTVQGLLEVMFERERGENFVKSSPRCTMM
jgi:hypothetical protein